VKKVPGRGVRKNIEDIKKESTCWWGTLLLTMELQGTNIMKIWFKQRFNSIFIVLISKHHVGK
jgi:hypothetical protein